MKIPSGVTDQYIYFVAVDETDLKTRETGLSSFTVYRSRNGAAAAAMTAPTVNETDATNMPGVYELLLNEDMTIDASDDTQEMVFHITATGMAPVTRAIELYRPKVTAGYTLSIASNGAVSSIGTGAITATSLASAAITAAKLGADCITADKIAANAITSTELADDAITADKIASNAIAAAKIAANALDGKGDWNTTTPPTAEANADAVWDEDIVNSHGTSNTAGRAVRTLDAIGDRSNNSNLDALLGVADSAGVTVTTQISAVETDTQNIQSRIPAALVSGRMSSDMVALSGSTTAADNLEQGSLALVTGAAAGTPTVTVIDTDLTEATDNHYNGRVLTFTSGVCTGETRTITDYNGTTKELTTEAFQTAPSASDTFVIS